MPKNEPKFFRNNKLTLQRNANIENKIRYDAGKDNFFPVFQSFQTYSYEILITNGYYIKPM